MEDEAFAVRKSRWDRASIQETVSAPRDFRIRVTKFKKLPFSHFDVDFTIFK